MKLLWVLGRHIEKLRNAKFLKVHLPAESQLSEGGVPLTKTEICQNARKKRPASVFLPGGNGLQTQAQAASNAGLGIIFVPEIKTGKSKYTDIDGSYGTFLAFHDPQIPGETFRKAVKILDIDVCRIQLVAAGVPED